MKPVRVRPITLLSIVGFKNNLAEMIIMARRCVANKNHVARLKVKITVRTQTLCIDLSETCSFPTYNFLCMVGFKNDLAQTIIITRRYVANKNHVARSKVKVIVTTLPLCIDLSETCSCPTHNFLCMVGFENNLVQIIIMIR